MFKVVLSVVCCVILCIWFGKNMVSRFKSKDYIRGVFNALVIAIYLYIAIENIASII